MQSRGDGRTRRAGIVLAAMALLWAGSGPGSAAPPPATKVDYNFQVRPLLADRCFTCHGPDEKKRKAKLRLDDPAVVATRVLVPGKPDESELIRRITAADPAERMPPAKSNLALGKEEIDLLRRWVAEGAEYKPHWAFLPPPDAVPVPAVADGRWPAGPLDRFVLARLEREGLKPSPAASKEDWIRRATFDLTGLPPTPGRGGRLPRRHFAGGLRPGRGPAAGLAALRRAAWRWTGSTPPAMPTPSATRPTATATSGPGATGSISASTTTCPIDQFVTWQMAGDLLPGATRRAAPGHRLLPAAPHDQRGRQHPRGVAQRVRLRSRPNLRHHVPRPDPGMHAAATTTSTTRSR